MPGSPIPSVLIATFLPLLAIEIGFRYERVNHSETEANYTAVLERDRPSEQTFQLEILISTPHIMGLGEPATQGDDFQANNVSIVTLTPDGLYINMASDIVFKYSCGSSIMMSGISCVENSVLPPSALQMV